MASFWAGYERGRLGAVMAPAAAATRALARSSSAAGGTPEGRSSSAASGGTPEGRGRETLLVDLPLSVLHKILDLLGPPQQTAGARACLARTCRRLRDAVQFPWARVRLTRDADEEWMGRALIGCLKHGGPIITSVSGRCAKRAPRRATFKR